MSRSTPATPNPDIWANLDRFLRCLPPSAKFAVEASSDVLAAAKADGPRAVSRIVELTVDGGAQPEAATFALAMIVSFCPEPTRRAAYRVLPQVCTSGKLLFAFCEACKGSKGWGRGMRQAIARWYNSKSPEALARVVAEDEPSHGWSHRDLLRMAHPKPPSEEHAAIYKKVVEGE